MRTKAAALLSVVKEIHDGGRDIIGSRWTLLEKMTAYAERDDLEGMKIYYERCLWNERGQRTAERLRRTRRQTLESEYNRFLSIYQSTTDRAS